MTTGVGRVGPATAGRGVELINKGDPVKVLGVTVNGRPGCTLKVYDGHTMMANAVHGVRTIYALTDDQAVMVEAIAKANGKSLVPGPIEFRTGDRVYLMALALVPSGVFQGVPGGP